MKTNLFKTSAFVLSLFLFASCMDDKYDLDNVDMTIGTSGDLTLPTCGTDSIVLENVMDLKDDGVVQIDPITGEFVITEEGSANIDPINIDPVNIVNVVLSDMNAVVGLYEILPVSEAMTRSVVGDLPSIDDIPHNTLKYTIEDNDGAVYDFKDGVSTSLPKEIISLDSVELADNTTLDASVSVGFGNGFSFINKVHLDSLCLSIPCGLGVSRAVYSRHTSEGRMEDMVAHRIDTVNGKIYFGVDEAGTMIGADSEIHILLTFDKAIVGQGALHFENGKISLGGECRVSGTFRVETSEFNKSAFTIDQIKSIIASGTYNEVLPKNLTFNGSASFANNTIGISRFSGGVRVSIGNINSIMLNDLPDFLNEPGVVLDLANPVVFVEVDNPMPAEATTAITLTGVYYDDPAKVEVVKTGEIKVQGGNGPCVYYLSENKEGVRIPERYNGKEVKHVATPGLKNLLKDLPSEIKVDVADITMYTEGIDIPKSYDLKVDYNIFTPLEFGEEFKLIYKGLEEGIGEDLNDVDKADTKGVRLEAVVETNLPLNLDLILNPLDKNNNNLKSDADNNNAGIVKVNKIEIEAHRGETKFSEQSITLNIVPEKGHTISEFLKKLDKFEYCAEARADGYKGKLMEDAYIKLKDIKITLVGGVSYDAN